MSLCGRDLMTAVLLRCCVPMMLLVCVGWFCDDACASDSYSAYVDMYNATSNSWTTFPTGIGQARINLATASLSSGLVFFAGGSAGIGTSACACQLRRLSLRGRGLRTTVFLRCLRADDVACVFGGLRSRMCIRWWSVSLRGHV